jgi:hypothetical protein
MSRKPSSAAQSVNDRKSVMDIECKFEGGGSISVCTLGDDQSYDEIIQSDRIFRWDQNDSCPGSVDGFGSPPVAPRRPDDVSGGSGNDGEIVEKLTLLETDKVKRRYRTMDTMPKPARRSISPSHRFRQNNVETMPKPARRSTSPISPRFRQDVVETMPKPACRSISPSHRFRGRWSVSPSRKVEVSSTVDTVTPPICSTISPLSRPQQATLNRTPPQCSRGRRSKMKSLDFIPQPAHRLNPLVQGQRVSLDMPPSAAQRRSSRLWMPVENKNEEDSEESSVSTTESAFVYTASDDESE